MEYEQFTAYLLKKIQEEWKEYNIRESMIKTVLANNGIKKDGLCVFREEERVSPTIYLEEYFEKYKSGISMENIMEELKSKYENGWKQIPEKVEQIENFECVRDQIILKVVNYEKNKTILEDCPYMMYYDLAITFRWMEHKDPSGIATALIHDIQLKKWDVTVEQLYEIAYENTRRLFPGKIENLSSVLQYYLGDEMVDMPQEPALYVFSNEEKINGATCILYQDMLSDFSDQMGCNFYIIPSSIHELLICPDDGEHMEDEIKQMIKETNDSIVETEDILSYELYYYSRLKKHLYQL